MDKDLENYEDDILDDEFEEQDEFDFDDEDLDEAALDANLGTPDAAIDKSVKAGRVTSRAKMRHNDKSNGEAMQKPQKGIVRELFDRISEMSEDEVSKLHHIMTNADLDALVAETTFDFKEELDVLVQSESTLSEEFRGKAAVIMETAIKEKVKDEVAKIEEDLEEQYNEALAEIEEELLSKIDSYLNYVVEQWIEQNELEIVNGLRTEIAEDFMEKLRDLFVESYIDVPESKIDVVDELAAQVDELEEELDTTLEAALSLKEELEIYKRAHIISELSVGLADSQIEKLSKLSENIDFEDEETFARSVKTIKETYFGSKRTVSTAEEIDEETSSDNLVESTDFMKSIVEQLQKSSKK